ncbi:MAG: riboflavin synthase, partial [Dehalococcoidales bacterium]|nr:riboflavin synthase [Dehalococcoidales bacterium]
MFTGITEEIGRIALAKSNGLVISASKVMPEMETGGSVAVNGVCLTVTGFTANSFSVDVMPETLERTNLGRLGIGSELNLERPLTLERPLGGHLVQGHIDDTGRVVSVTRDGEATIMKFETRPEIMHYIVTKGFIAVDGVSLTVLDRDTGSFVVSIVGYTRKNTTLGGKRVGDLVNLEVDIIAKYVERFSQPYRPGITAEFL